jgi:HPt (histidine-containing phosphotransfer) domain-containing protein
MDAAQPEGILNLAVALDRMGGDRELLEEVIRIFLATAPELLGRVRQAVTSRDCVAAERAAHALKGSVANFGAEAAYAAALRLESMAKSGDLGGCEEILGAVEAEMERLRAELAALVTPP